MCTAPISVRKFNPATRSVRTIIVPCGKCSECRAAYQSEFAALCALEANKRNSLDFFTFTYNNDWLPVNYLIFQNDVVGYVPVAEQRGGDCYSWQVSGWFTKGCEPVASDDSDLVCPSLRRRDIQALLKKFRSYCDRHGLTKDFSFSCFGEYGEKRRRPHFHMLVAGLSFSQAEKLRSMWSFGFAQVKHVPRLNPDGSDAYNLVSDYVSKYICKRDRLPDWVANGYAELPRRQSSIGFGKNAVNLDDIRPFLSRGGLYSPSSGNSR